MGINQNQPTAYDYVFPVFAGELDENGHFEAKNIYGTAFYINHNTFITCAHTVLNAKDHPITALGFQNPKGVMSFVEWKYSEMYDNIDVGLIQANIPREKPYKWLGNKLAMLNDVSITGYAFGLDDEHSEILIRSYKGHISMVGYFHKLKGSPSHYELSYMCPRGISGAPLIYIHENMPFICGMSIGSERTSMVVYSEKETNNEGNITSHYNIEEALHRGIAIQTEALLEIDSKLIGKNLKEYLEDEKLLIYA
jgi:V8-like Glu-specific endopeptidase